MRRFVLVGGGVATAATAAGLRRAGFDGDIVLVGSEPNLPYERPPLSKEYLAGTHGADDFRVKPEDWYYDNQIELSLGTRVEALRVGEQRVSLSDGRELGYDALVLGTGARARALPGFSGDRVHALRSIADAERLIGRLTPGRHLTVLGAGFIGCEVAAAAAARGVHVTVFEADPLPLARALGPEIGTAMATIHSEHGVDIHVSETVTTMTETGTCLRLETTSGAVIECDELLVGIGSVPNAELAAQAGLEVVNGVITDEYGRTGVPNVYAIGDVANRYHPGYKRRIRSEHHDTAVAHGTNAAHNLLGMREPFVGQLFFWSHQYNHTLQSVGLPVGDAATRVVRGSVEDRSFAVFSLVGGQIRAAVTLNRPRDALHARKVMAKAHEVTAEQIADDSLPIRSLLQGRSDTGRLHDRT